MNLLAQKTLQSYLIFAKIDSKLSILECGRDYEELAILMGNFSNLFQQNFNSTNAFLIYKKYSFSYFHAMLRKFENAHLFDEKTIDTLKKKYEQLTDIDKIIPYLRYIQSCVGRVEMGNGISTFNNVSTEEILDETKYQSSIKHYECFFEVQQKYKTLKDVVKDTSLNSNIVPISQFHQAITHLSRFMNDKNRFKEVYRFDSHIIRGTFDTQKLIIESIRNELKLRQINEKEILIEYISIKNIEVPGKNMSKFDVVFNTYNDTIKKYLELLNKKGV